MKWLDPSKLANQLGSWSDHISIKALIGLGFGAISSAIAVGLSEHAGSTAGRPLLLSGLLLASWFGGFVGGLVATVLMVATLVAFFYGGDTGKTENIINLVSFGALALLINTFNFWRRRVEQDLLNSKQELQTRIESERLLRELAERDEAYFSSIFNAVSEAILIADDKSFLLDANPAAEELLGRTRAELIGLKVADVVEASAGWAEKEYESFIASNFWRGQVEIRRPDGSMIPAEASAVTVKSPTGTVGISVLRDVSQRREMERLRETFLASVSHDLRSPLTAILGYALLMERSQKFDPEGIEEIIGQSRRLQRLISDLLDASAMQRGFFSLTLASCDLRQVIQNVVKRYESSATRVNVSLPEGAVDGLWDSQRLEQVLDNLVSNAIKYSPGSESISVDLIPHEFEAELSVIDSGVGLSSSDLEAIFGDFYRAGVTTASPGLGLGLYIARAIVEAHGGQVWAESGGPGLGSTFKMRIPYNPPARLPT